ncbi:MAG: GDSL family lipase [Candidatus Marinimicrobia bacterium]|nr:GDSL family lipase [Candidatus Neomarinimicrobiota bacterium]
MKQLTVHENLFEGAVAFQHGDGWLQPVRLKVNEIPLHHEAFVERATTPGGSRLRFATTSDNLLLEVAATDDDTPRIFDLTTDNALLATVALQPGSTEVKFDNLPPGRKTLELWLPTHQPVKIRRLTIDDGEELSSSPDPRPRWVTYGSSITHCKTAHSPSRTWPAVAARRRGLNLTSLGYGGNCQMEPLVAMMIRDLPAAFISLKVGINMSRGTVAQRTYRTLLIGMVKIIREKHPTTPIAVISPIISPPREDTPGATGMTLRMMRDELELAVNRLRECGDDNVHYFSGLELFGEDLVADYLPDLLHPNGDGYEIMGRNFATQVIDKILPQAGGSKPAL